MIGLPRELSEQLKVESIKNEIMYFEKLLKKKHKELWKFDVNNCVSCCEIFHSSCLEKRPYKDKMLNYCYKCAAIYDEKYTDHSLIKNGGNNNETRNTTKNN